MTKSDTNINFETLKEVFNDIDISFENKNNPFLEADLDMDSQEIVELLIALEDKLQIEIPDGTLNRMDNISSILVKINNLKNEFQFNRSDQIEINAPIEKVFNSVWDLSGWEKKLAHITSIEIIEENDNNQSFYMGVSNPDGNELKVESSRFKYDHMIYFNQPVPPQYLVKHGGYWEFTETPRKTTIITLNHQWIPLDCAKDILELSSQNEAESFINVNLKEHAITTLNIWKDVIEKL